MTEILRYQSGGFYACAEEACTQGGGVVVLPLTGQAVVVEAEVHAVLGISFTAPATIC